MTILYSDKWGRDEILDAYLQKLITNIHKETEPSHEGYAPVKSRLIIEWIEEID